ncbi:lysophospholipid acyltransferase family protein [Parvularcula dongshanensis]|uniref:DUF374 domain-containing protein n=1 Tax=Parvularcula dongshanensis TaxID=1173995 RepID=A0A840I7L5_9PROT|nr:lysophospholipid acyltransferase family protein [Parvularcula dongshanensis]MBB4660098.1 hypothetical protein [Parvularcula dongshanensis]
MASKDRLNDALLRFAPPLGAAYVRFVHRTTRWTRIGEEHHAAMISSGRPFICAFWHARLLMMPIIKLEQGRDFTMMISAHGDGEAGTRLAARFGIDAARGSGADPRKPDKAKGGAAALKGLVESAKAGRNIGVTPDGPRGPARQARLGVAQLARLTGLPVLPMSYSVASGRFLSSWDRFLVPFPFGRGVFAFGTPVMVEGRGPVHLEATRRAIEAELNRITDLADQMMGHAPIRPVLAPA